MATIEEEGGESPKRVELDLYGKNKKERDIQRPGKLYVEITSSDDLTALWKYWTYTDLEQSQYRETCKIRRTLVYDKIVAYSNVYVSWISAWWRCSNYIFILDLTHGFNGLGKDNCKTREKY